MKIISDLLLLLWIFTAVRRCYTDESFCPKGSRIERDGLFCYWMSVSASAWLEARDVCQRVTGGDLAEVDKTSVQNFIESSFQSEASASVWLRNRLHQQSGSAGFRFQHGEPGVCSLLVLGLGQWRTSPCNQEHHFICRKEITVLLPSLDSYVVGVPLMSGIFTQTQLNTLSSPPDVGQQRVEMMLFPGLWFSHGGQVFSVDLVSQPSQLLTVLKVQILRPYCSPNHHLVPPGCLSLLNPFSSCTVDPQCNTTGVCGSGQYWCPLLDNCLSVSSSCSPYNCSAAHSYALPPRFTALTPFYHTVADFPFNIPPSAEPVHYKVSFREKGISVYPDDIIAVQHTRGAGEFLQCVRGSDSAWRQSFLSLPGPELGGWVEAVLTDPTDGGLWVDDVVCDLRLLYEDLVHVYDAPSTLSSTQSDFRVETTTTPSTHSLISGLHVVYPTFNKQIHVQVNVPTLIIIKILSGRNATSTWSAPVSKTGIPFLTSCPPEIKDFCKRDTQDVWFSYAYFILSNEEKQTLNITASNSLNSQTLSVEIQAHIPVTGLSIHPQSFHRVLVDIPQLFTANVTSGSSVKYTWVTDSVQFACTGQTCDVVFKKPAEYILKVTAENPVSSQLSEVKLRADVMAPLADLTLPFQKEAVSVNISELYTVRVKLDISIGITIRWNFGDGSPSENHTISAPLEWSNASLDQTATQIFLQDSVHHTYSTPGDFTLMIHAENKYDHIKKTVQIKARSPLTGVLLSSLPAVPKVNQTVLFEASPLPSSSGFYTWNFGDDSLDITDLYNKVSHVFKAAGVYNVSVSANNTVSQLSTWMLVEVFETISGVHISYNGPNELNTVTEISGKVSTGTGLKWTFELGDGSVFKDLSQSSISHIYKSTGNYTAHITVYNAVSRARQSINVEIYRLAVSGIVPLDCSVSGQEINLQALVTGNISLLTFHWHFGDGTPLSVKKGTSAVAHTFSQPGSYLIDVTIYSQVGSAQYQSNVCVEALITDLNLLSIQNASAIGEEICFDASVHPNSESYQFVWYNSSSSDAPVNSGKSHQCFIFTKEGLHEITVIVHNQVSHKTAKATVSVHKNVVNLSIKHEGISNVLKVNQSYYFWIEPTQNNGVTEWDFGDGSPKMQNQNQSHVFSSAGTFQITASVSNAVSQEFVSSHVDVQVPILSIVINTNQSYAEAGQEVLFTVVSNVMENVTFYWTVDPLLPSKPGSSEYRYVFSKAGMFEVKVTVQNLISEMKTSTFVEVVERIQGLQITSPVLKSLRFFPTKESITLTASVKRGSSLTYRWLVHQEGFDRTACDGEHFKLFTNISGNVSVKLTVANALGAVDKDVTLRAVERVSGVNISTLAYVIAKEKLVNISVSVKTGTDLQYTWFFEPCCSPVSTHLPFILHEFKTVGIVKLNVSVSNVLGSINGNKKVMVQEYVSGIDFKVDGQLYPFFIASNSLVSFHGFAKNGNALNWEWTVTSNERNQIILANNQTVSYSFIDTGDHRVMLNVSNDISWQIVSHIVTVEEAIQDLNLRVSESVICENTPVTITPTISRGSHVLFLLEFAGGNISKSVEDTFTISSLAVGNHTIKAIAKNQVSILSGTVTVQVVERVKSLYLINCCSKVLQASKPFSFKASVNTGSGSQVTYQWSFQLNSSNMTKEVGQNVLYSPPTNGSLSITVQASSATFCSQSISETAAVQWPVKKVKLSSSPDGPFIDHPVTFFALEDGGTDLIFRWDFDDAVKVTKSNTVDHQFKAAGRFMVQVTVFNNVSEVSAQLPVEVRKLECLQPRVFLIQEHLNILKSSPNYFEASVELGGCVSYKTSYLWEIFGDPDCVENKISLNTSVDVSKPLLSLPKHALQVGNYCLKFTARFQGTPLQQHETLKISVLNSPLVALIKGGSRRMCSSQNQLLLDGTESYDPDATEQQDLQFEWNLTMQQNISASQSSGSFLADHSIQHNSSAIILPRNLLIPDTVYTVTLAVSKQGRSPVSTIQHLEVYEAEVLPVTVKCASCSFLRPSHANPSHPIALSGGCSPCSGSVQFRWTAEDTEGHILHLNEVTTSTGDRSADLVIRPDILTPGSEYIFTLNVSHSSTRLWGSARACVSLLQPPQQGFCTLSPKHSVQLLEDMVSFNCSGWVDEDSKSAQMIYSLQVAQCEDPGPQCPLLTLYRGTQHRFSSLVPLGSPGSGNKSIITVLVQVEDKLGAKVTALRRNLAVFTPVSDQNRTEWLKVKSETELRTLLQQSDPQQLITYSTALISQLNQLQAVTVQELEDRVQMRGDVTRALVSLCVSSLQDTEQISWALSLSTAVPSELQCGDCRIQAVESVKKMIRVIRDQTRPGDITPVHTGNNLLNVLSNSMTSVQKDTLGVNAGDADGVSSEAAVSALQQVEPLMHSLLWSRMSGEEPVTLTAPHIRAVGVRGPPAHNLPQNCPFLLPPALSSQLENHSEVLQVLLLMENQGNLLASAAEPRISTELAALEFITPQGLHIPITNLTSDSSIHITLHNQLQEVTPGVNITLPHTGSVNLTVRAVEVEPNTGLFITFNFSLIQGTDQISSGEVNIDILDQQGFHLHSNVQNLNLSTDTPSEEATVFLTPLLNGSSKDLLVTLKCSLSGAEVCVSVCVFSSLCQFFSVDQRRWRSEGVSVLGSSSPNTVHCLTQHLTLFGASMFIHPDAILLLPPWEGPVRNVLVGIVCAVLLLLHLLLGLIAHKLDHLDSLRSSSVPLCGPAGRYQYRVLVKTGWQRGAGTSAHVGISLFGVNKSGSRHLQREGAFQRNSLDDFQVETDANLGEIWKICIWHDNTGLDPAWFLQQVVVLDLQMDAMFFFRVDDWLSVENERNSGTVQKVVLATCPQELVQFSRLLCAELRFGVRDHHLWMSVWERPAHSSFTRAQRVTCCALLLHLYLSAGAVWYSALSTNNSSSPVAEQMLMNPETILVGMTVAVVMFPLQLLLTSLFRMTKNKVVMELSLPPSPVSDTVEMDVYISRSHLSCSSFLSMPRGPESSTHEGSSSFTESLDSLKLESDFWGASYIGNESLSGVDQWASSESVFGLAELMGPTRLLKRKRALLQLQLNTPTSDLHTCDLSDSPHLRREPQSLSEEELRSVSPRPFLSNTDSGPTTSDSGRYSPSETSLSDLEERCGSGWSELSGDQQVCEGLYKCSSSVSVCSVASTFLPSLPADTCSTTSTTRIGVARGRPGVKLPSWVLVLMYLLVAVLMCTCLAVVGLYGSRFSSSVVLMWLSSGLSAFLTSALLLEPLTICVRALFLAVVIKPVDPEVEARLAQETVVRKIVDDHGMKVRPPCGYGLLQAKEEARKVRMLHTLMKKCLVYMLFLLVVLMVNYQENIQEMNSRRLHSTVKHSLISSSPGQPNLTSLSGWMDVWQWMDKSLISHLHQNPSFSLIGSPRLQRVQPNTFCGGKPENIPKYDPSVMMFTDTDLTRSNSHHLKGTAEINTTISLIPWLWSSAQVCVFSETEQVLLGNSSVSTSHILTGLNTDHWTSAQTKTVLIEFTQYHRETGLFIPVSIQLENTHTHRIISTISIQAFTIPGSYSGLDLHITLTALLLVFSVCFLSVELRLVFRQRVQYLKHGRRFLQICLTLLCFVTVSLRLCFLSKANTCLSTHLSQQDSFTDFHSAALLARRASQLSAVLLTLLILQMVGALRFVRRWMVLGRVLQQVCSEMCGVTVLFLLLLLLFSHTGCVLFSGSVEGFRSAWQAGQTVLGLMRGHRALHQLCEGHLVLGPLYCLSACGLGFWMLGRLCGALLVHTYRTFQTEIHRPSMEPQDYEMVEFLIKRLKLWMGLSKAKEFRHRVKFEGMVSPPSRSSQFTHFSSLSTPSSPLPSHPSSSISPSEPRLISSASSLTSECSTFSDNQDLQQYLDRLLPCVESLLAGFDRVNQLTDDVLDMELDLEKTCGRINEKRRTQREQQSQTKYNKNIFLEVPQSQNSLGLKSQSSPHQDLPQKLPRRRGTHSESSIPGSVSLLGPRPEKQAWQPGPTTQLDLQSFPRRRAWHSGSCHSADPVQRSPLAQNQSPADVPVRPRSEERERSEVSAGVPVKRQAWHSESPKLEKS